MYLIRKNGSKFSGMGRRYSPSDLAHLLPQQELLLYVFTKYICTYMCVQCVLYLGLIKVLLIVLFVMRSINNRNQNFSSVYSRIMCTYTNILSLFN